MIQLVARHSASPSWALRAAVLLAMVMTATAASVAGQGLTGASLRVGKRPAPDVRPNILLLIADDLGVDNVGVYEEHPDAARTPVLDALAADGMLFRNAWSNQTCSPSRSTLLTGRYTFRTGVGRALTYANTTFELGLDEETLPQALLGAGYRTAIVGKWHLAAQGISGPMHPLLLGFEHHRGPMDNLPGPIGGTDYWDYEKFVDGVLTHSTTYATTDQVNDALELIASFGSTPWFVWLAFSAPHGPYHAPPEELHSYDLPPDVSASVPEHMRAMAEAMDTEIGRLLDSIPPGILSNTVVIFLADNGTTGVATTQPFDPNHAKATLYEGGVNVPLIMAGPGVVAGAEIQALVNLTDVVATVAELAEADASYATDGLSLVPYLSDPEATPLRTWVYSQRFAPVGFQQVHVADRRTTRDVRFKLLLNFDGSTQPTEFEFFDLLLDPFETKDLLLGGLTPFEQVAYNQLSTQMQGLQPW